MYSMRVCKVRVYINLTYIYNEMKFKHKGKMILLKTISCQIYALYEQM